MKFLRKDMITIKKKKVKHFNQCSNVELQSITPQNTPKH